MNELIHTLFYQFYRRVLNMVGSFAERCRCLISDLHHTEPELSADGCAVKTFSPLKQEIDKQHNVLLPLLPVLRKQRKDLIEMSGGTEEEFLSIGNRLHNFSSRAKSLSEQSAHIAGLFDESKKGNPLDQAGLISEEILVNLKMFDDEASGASSKINSIIAQFNELVEHEREFHVISRTLRVLGINIKIQGAQIKKRRGNSMILADKVNELSVKTDAIVNNLFDNLRTAKASMSVIADRIDKHAQKYRGKVEQSVKRIKATLVRLRKTFDSSTGLSANIASRSSEISKKVGEIVTSMQFHDISRQKMEHVAEAMEDICKLIEENQAVDNGSGQHLATYIANVAAVQLSQLGLIAHEMENAGKKMIAALEKIAQRTKDQSEEISKTTGSRGAESEDSIIVQFSSEISSLIFALSENTEINRYIFEEMKAVSKTVKEVSSFIKDVENIAENIKILALNAQIEAKHIGKAGLALGVLANEVGDISAQSNRVVDEVSTGIKAILQITTDLQTDINAAFTKGINEAQELEQRVAEARDVLNVLNREMEENIAGLDSKSQKLAHDIFLLTSEIHFFRKVMDHIGPVKETMQAIIETTAQYQDGTETELDETVLVELNDRYTMKSERMAHEEAVLASRMVSSKGTSRKEEASCCGNALDGSHQDTDIDGVELFEDFDALYEQKEKIEIFDQEIKDDDDLGDNIEIF